MADDSQPRTDVFLCECGPILGETIDFGSVEAWVRADPRVARVHRYSTLCSPQGQAWLTERLREAPNVGAVFAACTPREHQETFEKCKRAAGGNPYQVAVANIREQCGWIHSDRDGATQKAAALVSAALARCQRLEPLVGRDLDANCDAVVIGSGVAGLTAARTLAAAGRKVTLVERDPVVGGRTARLSDVFPELECASCMVEPLLDEVLHHDDITILTQSEVEEVLGYFGNFTLRIRKRARHVDAAGCIGCQSCQAVCPVEVPNEFEEGLSHRKAIYIPYAGALPNVSLVDEGSCLHFVDGSCDACVAACPFANIALDAKDELVEIAAGAVVLATGAELRVAKGEGSAFDLPQVFTTMALERMLNESGCTQGEIRRPDGSSPRSVALIHCADPRGAAPTLPCSKICCMSMIKYARLIREKLPGTKIILVDWDRCVGGKGFRQLARTLVGDVQVEEIRMGPEDRLQILPKAGPEAPARGPRALLGAGGPKGAGVIIQITRPGRNATETEVDMVVMAPPLSARAGIESLAQKLRLDLDGHGFLREEHARMRSFASRVEGVLVAGCAQGPKDVEEAASHGAAAAGVALSALVPGRKLYVDPTRARVDAERCGGCRTCPVVCPFKAITFDQRSRVAEVNELLCRGCGSCAAACPAAAIGARHFTDDQILAEINALVSG